MSVGPLTEEELFNFEVREASFLLKKKQINLVLKLISKEAGGFVLFNKLFFAKKDKKTELANQAFLAAFTSGNIELAEHLYSFKEFTFSNENITSILSTPLGEETPLLPNALKKHLITWECNDPSDYYKSLYAISVSLISNNKTPYASLFNLEDITPLPTNMLVKLVNHSIFLVNDCRTTSTNALISLITISCKRFKEDPSGFPLDFTGTIWNLVTSYNFQTPLVFIEKVVEMLGIDISDINNEKAIVLYIEQKNITDIVLLMSQLKHEHVRKACLEYYTKRIA